MNAEAAILVESPRPRWRRRLSVIVRRRRIVPWLEIGAIVALIAAVLTSYFMVEGRNESSSLLTPPMAAALLVANLMPAMALMVLIARRLAMRRAANSPISTCGPSIARAIDREGS